MKKKLLKRILSVILIVVVMLPLMIATDVRVAKADSNDRRRTFIQLSQGKNLSQLDVDTLDTDTLRVISLYLSNFYDPLSMNLSLGSKDQEYLESQDYYQRMLSALTAIGVDTETAKQLVTYCVNQSAVTGSQLYVKVSDLALYYAYVQDGQQDAVGTYFYSASNQESYSLASLAYCTSQGNWDDTNAPLTSDSASWYSHFGSHDETPIECPAVRTILGRLSTMNSNITFSEYSADLELSADDYKTILGSWDLYQVASTDITNVSNRANELEARPGDTETALNSTSICADYLGVIEDEIGKALKASGITSPYKNASGSDTDEASADGYVMLTSGLYYSLCTSSALFYTGSVKSATDFNGRYAWVNLSIPLYYFNGSKATACADTGNMTRVALEEAYSRLDGHVDSAYNYYVFTDTDAWELSSYSGVTLSDDVIATAVKHLSCYQTMKVDWVGTISALTETGFYCVLPGSANHYNYSSNTDSSNTPYNLSPSLYYWTGIKLASKTSDSDNAGWLSFSDAVLVARSYYNGKATNTLNNLGSDTEMHWAKSEDVAIKDNANWHYGIGTTGVLSDFVDKLGTGLTFNQNNNTKTDYRNVFVATEAITRGYVNTISDGSIVTKSTEVNGVQIGADGYLYVLYYDSWASITDDTQLDDVFKLTDVSNFIGDSSSQALMTSQEISMSVNTNYCRSLFYTYAFMFFNAENDVTDARGTDDTVFSLRTRWGTADEDVFPYTESEFSADLDELISSLEDDNAEQQAEIQSFIYYLLSPLKGLSYITTWFKNKIGAICIGWHEDIVGATSSNSSTGMTAYLGFSGYVTTPTLNDLDWMSAAVDGYSSIIVYILILLALVMLCYVISGTLSVQRAFLGYIIFAVLCFVPPLLISGTINLSNTVAQGIYSEKFDFWAITQMEEYLDVVADSDDTDAESDDYIQKVLSTQSNENSSEAASYTGVRLKWMSAKKANGGAAVASLFDSSSSYQESNATLKKMIINSVASSTDGESYIDQPDALYLYRDNLDIYRTSAFSYNLYSTYNYSGYLTTQNSTGITQAFENNNSTLASKFKLGADVLTSTFGSTYERDGVSVLNTLRGATASSNATLTNADMYRGADTSGIKARKLGFLYGGEVTTTGYMSTTTLASSYILRFNGCVQDTMYQYNELKKDVEENNSFNLTAENIANGSIMYGLDIGDFYYTTQVVQGRDESVAVEADYDYLSAYYYGLYSESPFYFFNYNIRDQLALSNTEYKFSDTNLLSKTSCIKDLFLNNNQEYFYNYNEAGYGELRDYMNFHDLFYYVIPSLEPGVQINRLWDDTFGCTYDDDWGLTIDSDGSISFDNIVIYNATKERSQSTGSSSYSIKGSWDLDALKEVFSDLSEEEKYKLWHDLNTYEMFYCYSAWLDTMMDCNYADAETIRVLGEKYTVSNPLDPYSYYKADEDGNLISGRYMVFSRSEMKYYGLNMNDLTTVEQKIIKVQDNVYEEAIDLMNYYTFSDETLIQAYTMIQLFEFNKEFSQEGIIAEDHVLYPQGYELKAFTYDAYLRLILNGSTDEDLMTDAGSDGNESIYRRILNKTSMFFAILLLINDFVAVYIIPLLKVFFIVAIFFISILLILGAAVKVDFNLVSVITRSLVQPLGLFLAINVGFSLIISLFLSNGADGVYQKGIVIQLGDPTMTVLAMLIINIVCLILYFKLCKKCFKDLKTYVTEVFSSISGAVGGAFGAMFGAVTSGRGATRVRVSGGGKGGEGAGSGNAKTRGDKNADSVGQPKDMSAKTAATAGAGAGAVAGAGTASAVAEATKAETEAKTRAIDAKAAMKQAKEEEKSKKAVEKAKRSAEKDLSKSQQYEALAEKNSKFRETHRGEAGSFDMEKRHNQLRSRAQKLEARSSKRKAYADEVSKYGKKGADANRRKALIDSGKSNIKAVGNTVSTKLSNTGVARVGRNIGNGAKTVGRNIGNGVKTVGRNIGNGVKTVDGYVSNGTKAVATNVKKGVNNTKTFVNDARAIGVTNAGRYSRAFK